MTNTNTQPLRPEASVPPTRRGFLGILGRGSVAVVAAFSGMMLRPAPALGHNQDCGLAKPHNPYCAYNCWRYAGYYSNAWVSPSGHNWCFECNQNPSSCYGGAYLCSQWGHM